MSAYKMRKVVLTRPGPRLRYVVLNLECGHEATRDLNQSSPTVGDMVRCYECEAEEKKP